jgi:hypothetical protein
MPAFDLNDDLSFIMFGGGKTTIPVGLSPEERFFHVVDNGLDWSAPEGSRSTHDLSAGVDFALLLNSHPDLPERYLTYCEGLIELWCDEPNHIELFGGTDDRFVDMAKVWSLIEAGFIQNGTTPSLPELTEDMIDQWKAGVLEALEANIDEIELPEEEGAEDIETFFAALVPFAGA